MWEQAKGELGGLQSEQSAHPGQRGIHWIHWNCALIIWILPSGALFYDQNVQNASCRLTFGVFAFPVTIHNGDKKKALEYIKRK